MVKMVHTRRPAQAQSSVSQHMGMRTSHARSTLRVCCRNSDKISESAASDRRQMIIAGLLAPLGAAMILSTPTPAVADVPLPQGYQDTARSLVIALRDAVDADLSGAEEREVRRKADPAKDLVRQFMSRWRDVPIVREDPSYTQLTGTIKDLGEFYMKNGQRARLPEDVGKALLARLDVAEGALPPAPEKKSLLPF